jgi:hypothetical protein
MNINGHEVERRDDGRMYVDDERTFYGGDSDPAYYRLHGELIRKEAEHADLVGEFVRREAVEKAAQDAADTASLAARIDLERRAKILVRKLSPHVGWDFLQESSRRQFRDAIRALDADATEQDT